MSSITIRRPERPIRAAVQLPRSKSVSNRALICATLAGDLSCVHDLSDADDTRILHQLLTERPQVMHCGLGGTTFRFLLAWAAIQDDEEHLITGGPRLLERPHDDLVLALRSLGADLERVPEGFRVRGRKLNGGSAILGSPISSQFISALMMIGPLMERGLRIEWKGRRLSEPYVEMTARVMRHFGAEVNTEGNVIAIAPGSYRAEPLHVPCDWSAAAFWYEIAGLTGDAHLSLPGLVKDGWQGDEAIDDLAHSLVRSLRTEEGLTLHGAPLTRPADDRIDLSHTPDLFPPLACLLALTGRAVTFTGLTSLPLKESDRLQAMSDAFAALGIRVIPGTGSFRLEQPPDRNRQPPPFDPHGDHRMAMALAPLALVCASITILDPDVVSKSYPGYWEDLAAAGFRLERS